MTRRPLGILPLLVWAAATTVGCSADPGGATPAAAAAPREPLPPIDHLSDDFSRKSSIADWQMLHAVEGWPSKIKQIDVNSTELGSLFLEPQSSGWYGDFVGPFVFKEVSGDFIASTLLKVRSWNSRMPQQTWSLGGILVRAPRRVTPDTWSPGGENWLSLAVGVADQVTLPVVESRNTRASKTTIHSIPSRAGWIVLRVARVGPDFVMMYRYYHSGEPWHVLQRQRREDLPQTLQVGVMGVTDWEATERFQQDALTFNRTTIQGGKPGMIALVANFKFRRPEVPAELHGVDLTRERVSEEALLAFLSTAEEALEPVPAPVEEEPPKPGAEPD